MLFGAGNEKKKRRKREWNSVWEREGIHRHQCMATAIWDKQRRTAPLLLRGKPNQIHIFISAANRNSKTEFVGGNKCLRVGTVQTESGIGFYSFQIRSQFSSLYITVSRFLISLEESEQKKSYITIINNINISCVLTHVVENAQRVLS